MAAFSSGIHLILGGKDKNSDYTLLSDLQIDAIKTRLKLTPAQERSWPAVETALRSLAMRLHDIGIQLVERCDFAGIKLTGHATIKNG